MCVCIEEESRQVCTGCFVYNVGVQFLFANSRGCVTFQLPACIKEKYDMVKCWQGELIYVPEKWTPFDVVFLYFLPALPFELCQILEALRKRCLPGARVVISHPQGRQVVEEQQKKIARCGCF
ncbi:uncharacterized protein LOC107870380 isoform X2 [Capsicum annuum]|uniref:uncharacterized protein LOC107870380 isoform X2 n=1 Tax=Capsicum annuum TaxID=4072 RepID=UPI0007BED47E|nr:uncharacterized protein LOC107870380 isoform X2 [Capsicum annuum]